VRALVLSTVFPNVSRPTYGVFVRERVRHVAALCDVQVVAPVPWVPAQQWLPGRETPRPPAVDEESEFPVYHPGVFSIPGVAKSLDGVFYCLSLLPFLRRLRRRFAFDVIDAQFAYPDGFGAMLLGRALRCPVVITLRGYEADLVRYALRRPQLRLALRRVRVIAVSDFLGRLACDLGARPERVRVVPNGVDASRFHPRDRRAARVQLGLPADRTILLSVGAFVDGKGHERVLNALPQIIAQRPDLLWVAVGNHGGRDSRLDAIRRRVRAQGLGERVRLEVTRPHEEMPSWMAAADLFCLATRREGWCNAIAEALACGVPVVTTRVGGNPEVVRDGEDGFLIPYFDAAAFAAAITRGLEHGWDRAAIARRAAARSWPAAAAAVVAELELARREWA
jgi:glycosyltransferase involved in cell wall biosynthesis